MRLITKLILAFFIGFTVVCSAQLNTYNFQRELSNIDSTWHKIEMPNAMFGKIQLNFSDIRLYGIDKKGDTIEAPYFIKTLAEKKVNTPVDFSIINKTKSTEGYYFTFKLKNEKSINSIIVDFKNENFDWKVILEGSQNQSEWFTILNDYRLLSIKNPTTNFSFTTLNFPETEYKYYRLLVKSNEQPNLNSAKISNHTITEGVYNTHDIKTIQTTENKVSRKTIIDVSLLQPVSVNTFNIDVTNTFDYYRRLKIEYKHDSTKTENGWKYYYQNIYKGWLNSLDERKFRFPSVIAKDFRITIYNNDNQLLSVSNVVVKGYQHQLISRFTENANYVLAYGNSKARRPNYDISKFKSNIPKNIKSLKIGAEQSIVKPEVTQVSPLFENSYWLWVIIGVVVLLLGGFTLKMLGNSEK